LLRWLLNQAQSCQGGYSIVITNGTMYGGRHYSLNIGDSNFEEVCEHALLLGDSSLAVVRDLGRSFSGPTGVVIDRLTMEGHDFSEAAQNETLWQKAMTVVNEKGGAVTVGVLTQILSTLVKQSFGLS
jgi:Hypothetical protein (DUF2513)